MDGIGTGPCTLEHIEEQSLQEGRDCTLRKKRKRREHIHNHLLGRVKKLRTLETTLHWIVRFSRSRWNQGSALKGLLTSTFIWCQQTFIKLISNSVFQSSFRTIFCWQTSTTKINNDKMIIQKACRTPNSLGYDFTVAKRFMKRTWLKMCSHKANLDDLKTSF